MLSKNFTAIPQVPPALVTLNARDFKDSIIKVSIYPRLREKYEEVYLLRNEHDLKLWDFDTGAAFEPDYVLLMRRRGSDGVYDNIQIFIEPKGRHLRDKDAWKQRFLMSVRDRSVIHFSTHSGGYEVWGMPFFSSDERAGFDASICRVLNS